MLRDRGRGGGVPKTWLRFLSELFSLEREREREIWRVPKIRCMILGVPIIRTLVVWDLYWGPPILGQLPYIDTYIHIIYTYIYILFLHMQTNKLVAWGMVDGC